MGRQHRRDFDYAFHHVMNRASARRFIFAEAKHRNTFLDILEQVVCADGIQIHAYCLMGNHYHLLVRTPRQNLSEAMQRLGSTFSRRFNRVERIDGPLFRGRFKSIIVGHDDYLRQLCRYIHRNPVAAGVAKTPHEYEWSSYRAYAGLAQKPEWLTTEDLPKYFPGPNQNAEFRAFVEKDEPTEIDSLSADALFKHLRHEPKDTFRPSRCLERPYVDRSFYLAPASFANVLNEVMDHYKIGREAMLFCKPSVRNMARDVGMFLAKEEAFIKLHEIADAFEIRPPAASAGVTRVKRQMQIDAGLKQDIVSLKIRLQAYREKLPAWAELSKNS